MEMALHGAFGKIKHVCHLLNTTVLKIEKRNHLLLYLWQPLEKLLYLHLFEPRFPIGGRRLTVFDGQSLPVGLRPKRRKSRISSDAIKPSRERSPAIVVRKYLPHLQKDILRHLF